MKFGFDAKKIVRNLTGIGNYSRGIVEALDTYFPEHSYRLYSPNSSETAAKQRLKVSPRVSFVYPESLIWKAFRELWRIRGVNSQLRRDHIDIFHGLSNELPFGITKAGCRTVVTIHDLIFLRLPSTYSWSQRLLLRRKTRYACQKADLIVAISDRTRRDIIDLYGIDGRKIRVVYQGCDPAFRQKIDQKIIDETRQHYGLTHSYLLSVGTFEYRKNQLLAVEAMQQVPDGIDLVLIGKRTPYQQQIVQRVNELGLGSRVHILNDVPQVFLPALYQGAAVFLYLSRYEGFGIPVLEALCSGIPVVAASGSCLEEVGGDAALYCSPDDANGLSDRVNHLLSNSDEVALRVARGHELSLKFTPQRIASDMMAVYNELMETHHQK